MAVDSWQLTVDSCSNEEGRRKRFEGSSATDFITDLTDVTDEVRQRIL
ncbi:hypothetical protein K4039_28895 [Lyngbya sp. CCAP 1446/10]|nr:hypothetical protein [Lyngbya sp. CCAP 1446/10]MCW6053962.1 hypothetical protein [Lyngbya sp. CCAP 1446/10]